MEHSRNSVQEHGLFGVLKLATLILALQFLLKQCLFQDCNASADFSTYTKVIKSTALSEFRAPNKLS